MTNCVIRIPEVSANLRRNWHTSRIDCYAMGTGAHNETQKRQMVRCGPPNFGLIRGQEFHYCRWNVTEGKSLPNKWQAVGVTDLDASVRHEIVRAAKRVDGNTAKKACRNQVRKTVRNVTSFVPISFHNIIQGHHISIDPDSSKMGQCVGANQFVGR